MKMAVSPEGFDVFVLALQCTHASSMIGTCVKVIEDKSISADDRHLACEVLLDAREALWNAREELVARGANVRRATAAVLRLAWPVTQR